MKLSVHDKEIGFQDIKYLSYDIILHKNNEKIARNNTIPNKNNTKLFGFHTMRNKNNTRFAALLITPAALLTTLTQNNAVAAPKDIVPLVSPLAAAKTIQVMASGKTLYINKGVTSQDDFIVLHISLQNPNKVMVSATKRNTENGLSKVQIASDGKTTFLYDGARNQYHQVFSSPYHKFFAHFAKIPSGPPTPVVFNKTNCLRFAARPDTDNKLGHSFIRLWLNAVTLLPVHEEDTTIYADKRRDVQIINYNNWKLNATLDPALFVFTPPPGAKLIPNDNTIF